MKNTLLAIIGVIGFLTTFYAVGMIEQDMIGGLPGMAIGIGGMAVFYIAGRIGGWADKPKRYRITKYKE